MRLAHLGMALVAISILSCIVIIVVGVVRGSPVEEMVKVGVRYFKPLATFG